MEQQGTGPGREVLACAAALLALALAACPARPADSGPAPSDGAAATDGGGGPDAGSPLDAGAADGGSAGVDAERLAQAEAAARWVEAVALQDGGVAWWPEYIGIPEWTGDIAYPLNLYGGVAGTGLFLLKLSEVSDDPIHREMALAAADRLVALAIETPAGHYWEHEVELSDGTIITYDYEGLYEGAAGVALTLLRFAEITGDPSYLDLAESAAAWIRAQATVDGDGCSWLYQIPDIIAGNAGIVLALLEMYEATGNAAYLDDAVCAGDWLVAQCIPQGEGCTWPGQVGWDRVYTGLSHGVAGVAYALARLYEVTGDVAYLSSAEAGATWLESVAVCDGLGCRWFHYTPDGTDVFQTGWCHGVAGTARLFLLLDRLTGDTHYGEVALAGAQWVMAVADPALPFPEFWNLSLCCGAASVGEFFLDLHLETGDAAYLDFARAVADYVVDHGLEDRGGMTWTNYDYPDSTGRIWYATGLKLGGPGIGWFLLRLALQGSSVVDWPMLPDERL